MTNFGWWFIPCITNEINHKMAVVELPEYKIYICSSCGGSYGILARS